MDWSNGYIEWVQSNPDKVNNHITDAVSRHVNDVKKAHWIFDVDKALRAIRFIELLPHTKGVWASRGEKLKLEPWQRFLIGSIFGWVDDYGKRRYREAYIRVPRKNGKSILGAGVGLYMMLADGEDGAEVFSGATELNQAKEVFKPAWLMLDKYDKLKTKAKIELYGSSANPSKIFSNKNNAIFRPIKGKPGDGSSPHCAIIDEYHEHPDNTMYDAMRTGMGARQQPLLFIITTAGTRTDGPCYAKDRECQELMDGTYENDRLFTMLFGMDEDDDPFALDSLIKANPNYGVSVMPDFLQMQLDDAKARGGQQQTIYMIKHLNKWVSAKNAWMNMALWNKLGQSTDEIIAQMGDLRVFVGLDLASRLDITAVQFLAYNPENDQFLTFGRYFLPEEAIKRCHSSVEHIYADLIDRNAIIVTPGEVTDYDYILNELVSFDKQLNIIDVGYDRYASEILYNSLSKVGFADRLVQYSMAVGNRSEPMKEIEARVVDSKFMHDDNPAMNWMMGNVVAKLDANDNIIPRKESPERKIDAVDATIIAMGLAMDDIAKNSTKTINDILFF